MKIAFILQTFPRLHHTFIVNEIISLLRLGVEVTVFSLDRPIGLLVSEDRTTHSLSDRTLYFDDFEDDGTAVPANCAPYAAACGRSLPSRWKLLMRGQFKRQTPTRYAFGGVARHLREAGYDVIHAGFGNRPSTAALVLSEMTAIPWTFETHAYDLFVDFPFAAAKLASARLVVTKSEYHRAYLEETLSAPPEKVKVIHLALDSRVPETGGAQPGRKDLIVSVCRLHPIKGLTYALQAVAKIRSEFPHLEYVIVGGGALKSALVREARHLRIADIVRFVNAMTNEEACRIVGQAAVFLLASVVAPNGDRDGTPTAIAEAMQLEVPVVSSRISGIPELVEDGVTGILTPPGAVDDIADALRRLLMDGALRQRMGRAGRKKILEDFNDERTAAELLACWEQVLSGNSSEGSASPVSARAAS